MGIFGKLFGKKEETTSAQQNSSSSNISSEFGNVTPFDEIPYSLSDMEEVESIPPASEGYKVSLLKKTEDRQKIVKISLEKKKVPSIKARIVVVMDDSGSMHQRLKNGLVKRVFERTIPLALEMDDNGEVECYKLTRSCVQLPNITLDNINGYADTYFIASGGTNYEPTINVVAKRFGEMEPSSIPTLVLFFTDGDADFKDAAKGLIRASRYNVFFQFIGLGTEDMTTLENLDNLPTGEQNGRLVDNADFFRIKDADAITDEEFYEKVLNEFPGWIEQFNANPKTVKPANSVQSF